MKILDNIINQFTQKPKRLFLVDGIGALISAFMIGVVLIHFENQIGMHQKTLIILAIIPCIFFLYDLFCYFSCKHKFSIYVNTIAVVNTCYCILSLFTILFNFQSITTIGLVYFILELAVVVMIIYLEFETAHKLREFENELQK